MHLTNQTGRGETAWSNRIWGREMRRAAEQGLAAAAWRARAAAAVAAATGQQHCSSRGSSSSRDRGSSSRGSSSSNGTERRSGSVGGLYNDKHLQKICRLLRLYQYKLHLNNNNCCRLSIDGISRCCKSINLLQDNCDGCSSRAETAAAWAEVAAAAAITRLFVSDAQRLYNLARHRI